MHKSRGRARHRRGLTYATRHVAGRRSLSSSVAGIDHDIERIFLNLPSYRLEALLIKYGKTHGEQALTYARRTYGQWKSGAVKMSGAVAERLLNLVPPYLDAADRLEMVKKLRAANLPRVQRHVSCKPEDWRITLRPILVELVDARRRFQLPQHLFDRVRWLAAGDIAVAQRLLVNAEEDEARVRLEYLEREFCRIDELVREMKSMRAVTHTINIPQGTIVVTITLPPKGVWAWINSFIAQCYGPRFSR